MRSGTRAAAWMLAAIFALALGPTAPAQEERVYFSLRTDRTFAPGEKASINVYAQGVDALEMRVYRVKDPAAFFQKLDDPHQFGGRVPRPEHEVSALERIHEFKRRMWTRVRDFFRGQFSSASRAQIRSEERRVGKECRL